MSSMEWVAGLGTLMCAGPLAYAIVIDFVRENRKRQVIAEIKEGRNGE